MHLVQSLNVLKYNEPNLPSKIITCLEKDADNNLWVGLTNDDYAVIDTTGVIKNYQFPSKINHDIVNIRHFENESWVVSKSGLLKIANGQKNITTSMETTCCDLEKCVDLRSGICFEV